MNVPDEPDDLPTGLLVDLAEIGRLKAAWLVAADLSTDPARVMTKATEELGEVSRALTGELEQRAGRGDVVEEAAQLIGVIASLVHLTHPEADLGAALLAEMRRLGAIPDAAPDGAAMGVPRCGHHGTKLRWLFENGWRCRHCFPELFTNTINVETAGPVVS